jgi:hypothetical protein
MYIDGVSVYGYIRKDNIEDYEKNLADIPKDRLHTIWECPLWKQNLANDNMVTVEQNEVVIKILNLKDQPIESRYTMIVDTLIELVDIGILQYNFRVDNPTEKNKREAMRLRGLRDWWVSKYEANIYLDHEYGTKLLKDLKQNKSIPREDKYKNGVYLRTDKQIKANKERALKQKSKIKAFTKYYDMSKRHLIEAFKLEVTIDSQMISDQRKAHRSNNNVLDLKSINVWLDHPRIQDIPYVNKKIESGINLLLNNISKDNINEMKEILEISNKKDIPTEILSTHRTLKEVVKRIDKLEFDIQRIDKVLKELGLPL